MKKINKEILYRALCDALGETPIDKGDAGDVEQHLKNLVYTYSRNKKIDAYTVDNEYKLFDRRSSNDLLDEVWADLKYRRDNPHEFEEVKEEIYATVADIQNILNVQPTLSKTTDKVSEKTIKQLHVEGINRMNGVILGMEEKLTYKPPFILGMLKFIPSVKNIINYNEGKYIVETWKNLSEDEKQVYISNVVIKRYLNFIEK